MDVVGVGVATCRRVCSVDLSGVAGTPLVLHVLLGKVVDV